jgi:hypothetical protein
MNFQSSRHRAISDALFSFWILSRRFAIWIALVQSNKNRFAPLCSKWKQVFFMITSLISVYSPTLLIAPQETTLDVERKIVTLCVGVPVLKPRWYR